MREEWLTDNRKERRKDSGEDFTPESIVELMYNEFPEELYTDFSKTILDPCAGIGNLLIYCIKRRLEYCNTENDVYNALKSIHGSELFPDNVAECHQHIMDTVKNILQDKITVSEKKIKDILNHNIVCTDTFKWDYENWCPKQEKKCNALF